YDLYLPYRLIYGYYSVFNRIQMLFDCHPFIPPPHKLYSNMVWCLEVLHCLALYTFHIPNLIYPKDTE
ncbi:MAG: hypothetical protein KKD77_20465, partial [Gammaproteobacteria bacterium]|nr:hypothetical protein [Gammaproteobacteria bacterium]